MGPFNKIDVLEYPGSETPIPEDANATIGSKFQNSEV
jgi:hypothetical protein